MELLLDSIIQTFEDCYIPGEVVLCKTDGEMYKFIYM